jgi:crossover junction endodeoxyribonuclease RuvC
VVEDAGGGRILHIAHGVIALEEKAPLESRLHQLFEALSAEMRRHAPRIVAVEEIFYSRNARSALVLGHARGVALLAAAIAGAEVRSFAATVIKQAVTGSGRAEKEQVARMIKALLGVRVAVRADASDALAIALCGALRGAPPGADSARTEQRTPAAANLQRLLQEAKHGAKAGMKSNTRRSFARAKRRVS